MNHDNQHIDFDRNYCEHYKPVLGTFAPIMCLGLALRTNGRRAKGGDNRTLTPCIGGT